MSLNTKDLISATLNGQDPAQLWNESEGAIHDAGESESVLDADEIRMSQEQETEAPGQEVPAAEEEQTESQAKAELDYIPVTGSDGQRQKIKVDWNDKEKIKKQISMAFGARKWQAERDQAIQKATKAEEKAGAWDSLEQAWSSGSSDSDKYSNVLDLLSGKTGGAKDFLEQYYQRRTARETANPEQLKQYEAQELQSKRDSENQAKDQELAKLRQEQTKFMEDVRSKEANILVQPIFNRFSFEGKLGNAEEEGLLNETMWNQAISRMEKDYPEGHTFTNEEINKEFKLTHTKLNNLIKGRVEKEVTKVIDKKKTEAKSKVQTMAKAGYTGAAKSDEMAALVKKGDFHGLFSQYNKFFGNK